MHSPAVSAGEVDGGAASVLGATAATLVTEGGVVVVVVVVDVTVVVVVELTATAVIVGATVAVVGVVATGREGGDPFVSPPQATLRTSAPNKHALRTHGPVNTPNRPTSSQAVR